jgi:hypothetical protein
VINAAESVGHAMLAAVVDEQDMDLAEDISALGAADRPLVDRGGLDHLASFPMRSLDRPRNHVLEAAERRPALAGGLIEPKAVVGPNRLPAPGAGVSHRVY